MSVKRFILLLLFSAALFCACSKKEDSVSGTPVAQWGRTRYFKDFAWKKWKPDTLKQTLVFDFNRDAVMHMQQPLELALYKKSSNGKMVRVKETEMRLFVDGNAVSNNVLKVLPNKNNEETEVEVGIVFDPSAENKVHHWFFKPVNAAGLERINDLNAEQFGDESSSLYDIQAEKVKVPNPLATGTTILGIIILAALVLWLTVLQYVVYPRFSVRSLTLIGPEPYLARKTIRRAKQVVLTSKRPSQSYINKLFTGKIVYEVNELWTSDIVIIPRDRKSVRISQKRGYLTDANKLMLGQEYLIQNETTNTKTIIKIQ